MDCGNGHALECLRVERKSTGELMGRIALSRPG